jgi:hypothetical protein
MPYTERLEILTYQSPKRKTFDLEFEDLARSITRKNAINEFPYQDKANVQDLGMGNLKIPIRCFITGNDYDLEADRFFKALNEQGYGVLDHPRWGSIDVLPISITQSESFVENTGRAIFEIEFVQYFPDATEFPENLTSLFRNILGLISGVIDLVFQAIDSILTIETSVRRFVRNARRIAGSLVSETRRIESRYKGISNKWKEDTKNNFVTTTFGQRFSIQGREPQDNFNKSLRAFDEYIENNPNADPKEIVSRILGISRLPQNENINGLQLQKSYSDTIDFIESQFNSNGSMSNIEAILNGYTAIGFICSMCEKVVNSNINTRNEIIELVEKISEKRNQLKVIVDKVSQKNGNIDYDILQQTYLVIVNTQKALLELSLQLPTERKIIITKDTTPIEFVFSLDGSIDRLDELINYNNLQNKNILVIPKNYVMRYY